METISVGKPRQNPTEMLRSVERGEHYTVTDRGRPIAQIVPVRGPRWVPSERVADVLRSLEPDNEWASEIAGDRTAEAPAGSFQFPGLELAVSPT